MLISINIPEKYTTLTTKIQFVSKIISWCYSELDATFYEKHLKVKSRILGTINSNSTNFSISVRDESDSLAIKLQFEE